MVAAGWPVADAVAGETAGVPLAEGVEPEQAVASAAVPAVQASHAAARPARWAPAIGMLPSSAMTRSARQQPV